MKKLREAISVFFGCLGVMWIAALVYIAFGYLSIWSGGGK